MASYAPAGTVTAASGTTRPGNSRWQRASARDEQFRISTLADFEGIEVRRDSTGADACWH